MSEGANMDTADDLFAEENDLNIIEEQEDHNESEGEKANADEEEKKLVKPKRSLRNPQIKLNEETLKGPRGLTALQTYFKTVKFKGRHHEQETLSVIVKTYEYWCHRMFPKLPFDDSIERIEKLGNKKDVKNYIKQIRMDLIDDVEKNNHDIEDILSIEIAQAPPPIIPRVELNEEMLEKIRINKEKAENIRKERLKRLQGTNINGNCNTQSSEQNVIISQQLPISGSDNLSESTPNVKESNNEFVNICSNEESSNLEIFDNHKSSTAECFARTSVLSQIGNIEEIPKNFIVISNTNNSEISQISEKIDNSVNNTFANNNNPRDFLLITQNPNNELMNTAFDKRNIVADDSTSEQSYI